MWSPSVLTEFGQRSLLKVCGQSVVTEGGHRMWSKIVVAKFGQRLWSQSVVTECGHRI